MLRRVFGVLFAFALFFVATSARAAPWTPPPLNGHVVDQAGALTPEQRRALDLKLDDARQQTGFAVVVLLLPRLPDGLTIDDVGYTAGNAWGVGSAKGDDGVLLIHSAAERKLRIETGKGVGGALTDVESSHINTKVIAPLLVEGRTYDAIDAGTDAILKALVEGTPGGKSEPGRAPAHEGKGKSAIEEATPADLAKMGAWIVALIGIIALAIYSPTFRSLLFWLLFFGRGGGGGGSSGGGGGGSGYGGGGGRFGGGGSSDGY
ncbi:MAG: TPM domain-containing protein [Labilithrix sp.]|nr:TPM domain-containing protein [Labilithrix sp.]MCW5814363.1 TPM domain-containing protein [Labilithrix sp.]